MLKTLKKELLAQIALALFVFFTIFWIINTLFFPIGSPSHEWFANTYGILALWGGAWGLVISKKWGGFKSIIGKAILFFSFGLLAQVFGQVAYSYYYYYLGVEIPYPSLGDLGYFGSIPLYIFAVLLLARASGVKISLRSFKSKAQAVIIPILILGFSYYAFLQGYEFDWSAPLVIFLDFGYPLGQATYISFAILTYLLSKKTLGGIMKGKIFLILFALVIQYIADYHFLYQISKDTWYASGPNDYIYLASYFAMAIGLIQLKTTADGLEDGG